MNCRSAAAAVVRGARASPHTGRAVAGSRIPAGSPQLACAARPARHDGEQAVPWFLGPRLGARIGDYASCRRRANPHVARESAAPSRLCVPGAASYGLREYTTGPAVRPVIVASRHEVSGVMLRNGPPPTGRDVTVIVVLSMPDDARPRIPDARARLADERAGAPESLRRRDARGAAVSPPRRRLLRVQLPLRGT